MNDSILEKDKKTTENVASSEKSEKDVIALSNGDKVDKATGEIIKDETNNEKKALILPIASAKSNNSTETSLASVVKNEEPKNELTPAEKENEMRKEVNKLDLKNLNVKLMYEMMSVPTCSSYEYRMVTYLILWARKHNIDHHFDSYGNLYFVKGKPNEGEFYPCVTAHLDTVQHKAKAYVLTGAELDLKTRVNTKGQHEVYIDGMGTGSDDKNAILIALHMFEHFDTLKGAFYLEEETGCKGSHNMDVKFFDDVSYVIGFDSPELNRAAWSLCSNIKMFNGDFYRQHMKPVCDKYGMTRFLSESVTDEAEIIRRTGLTCMNFGNAGYKAHMADEYFIVEELDNALSMGIELVQTIPTNIRHMVKTYTWEKDPITGSLKKTEIDDKKDIEFLKTLGDNDRYGSYYNNYNHSSSSSSNVTNRSDGYFDKKDSNKNDNSVNEETIQYIVDTYEERIEEIKESLKTKCKELNLDFEMTFANVFNKEISF